jgi:hypothetical protein
MRMRQHHEIGRGGIVREDRGSIYGSGMSASVDDEPPPRGGADHDELAGAWTEDEEVQGVSGELRKHHDASGIDPVGETR